MKLYLMMFNKITSDTEQLFFLKKLKEKTQITFVHKSFHCERCKLPI